jgi:hypothetical protein
MTEEKTLENLLDEIYGVFLRGQRVQFNGKQCTVRLPKVLSKPDGVYSVLVEDAKGKEWYAQPHLLNQTEADRLHNAAAWKFEQMR